MAKEEEKEARYLGATYVTVNSINEENREAIMLALAKFTMELDKCRMVTYSTVNIGQPHCGPQGCN